MNSMREDVEDRAEIMEGEISYQLPAPALPAKEPRGGGALVPYRPAHSWLERLRGWFRPVVPAGIEQAKLFVLSRANSFGLAPDRARIILVAGVGPKAGTTTVAASLAETIGKDVNGRVILVDPRPERSWLRRRLRATQIHPDPQGGDGHGVVLLRAASENFDVLQVPRMTGDPEPLIRQYLRDCDTLYSYIIVDGGAVQGPWPDRLRHLSLCSLLVMDCQKTNARHLARVRKLLDARDMIFDGVFMNRQQQYVPDAWAKTVS